MFRIIFPNTWYVDHHGTPCKILRSTHNKVHYIRKGRTCIAMNRPGFPGEYFICELRLPDHYFR
ncbi:DUF4222 domain-containing protein, partial [Escherichia coli]|uniref:DUF4222 domain-containing protein n=1 Tax=Escherichia coli TaxID=562 RepID=UPI000AF53C79